MAQYMLSVHHDGSDFDTEIGGYADEAEMQEAFAATEAFNQKIMDAGQWVFGGGLQTPDSATTVRPHGRRHRPRPTAPTPRPRSSSAASGSSRLADLDAALALAREAARWPARAPSRSGRSRASRGLSRHVTVDARPRPRLPRGARPGRRHPDPPLRRHRRRRGGGPGGVRRRRPALARDRRAAEPRRLDPDHGPQPGHRPLPPGVHPPRPPAPGRTSSTSRTSPRGDRTRAATTACG